MDSVALAAAECAPVHGGAPKPAAPRPEAAIMAAWIEPGNEGGDSGEQVPLVSIVCHSYNHAPFIRDALNGFLMQETRFPFEILVNDDASTDGTAEIIREYQARYPHLIRVTLQRENQFSRGVTPRNFTFPRVRGTYIALCEGDDYWVSTTKLQQQAEAFEPGVALVFHDAISITEDRVRDESYYRPGSRPLQGYSPSQLARGCKVPTASAMFLAAPFRKDRHENVINGDHLIWATLASLGRAKFLPHAWSVYRYHDGGIWSARSVLHKVEPSLRSKRVIFDCVDRRFKTSATVGYAGVALTLLRQLQQQGETAVAARLTLRLYAQVLKMLPQCQLAHANNGHDLLALGRILALRVPRTWLRVLWAKIRSTRQV